MIRILHQVYRLPFLCICHLIPQAKWSRYRFEKMKTRCEHMTWEFHPLTARCRSTYSPKTSRRGAFIYHLCVRNQNPFCRDFFAFKPDWLKFRVVRLILPEAASTLSQVLHRSSSASSAKSSSPLSSPSHPKHSNQNGIRIKRCFPR